MSPAIMRDVTTITFRVFGVGEKDSRVDGLLDLIDHWAESHDLQTPVYMMEFHEATPEDDRGAQADQIAAQVTPEDTERALERIKRRVLEGEEP
jgi:hypothetical protein